MHIERAKEEFTTLTYPHVDMTARSISDLGDFMNILSRQ